MGHRGWGGGSVGFDGLARLDLMVARLGWFSWWVCGLVELKGMDLATCVGL